jgi:ferredoxin
VDCFHAGPNFLVIDPDVCIDCAVCIPECPVGAIKADRDLESNQQDWIQINADLAQAWPVITEKTDPYPGADEWAKITSKRHLLDRG